MPKLSRTSSQVEDYGPIEVRQEEAEGYTINFITFREHVDHEPLLKGLPDDRCSCPHWGYVLRGSVTFQFGDREETFEEGDAFYAPPGHVPRHEPGTEYLQFSPTEDLQAVSEVIMKNFQEMQPA